MMPDLQYYPTSTGDLLPGVLLEDGIVRHLGCRPASEDGKLRFQRWGASGNPIIPRSDWKAFDRTRPEIPMLDQAQTNSCVGHGSTKALMYARAAAGMQFVRLSSCFLYGLINGGRDAGANIDDAMTALIQTGTCPESMVPEGMLFQSQFPKSAFAAAANYRVESAYLFETWDEAVSAALLDYDLSISVVASSRGWAVTPLDSNGCPPLYRGTGNHDVYMGRSLTQKGGTWLLGGDNSWGTNWGDGGHFNIREEFIAYQNGFVGFAIRYAVSDPTDPTNPPVVI